MTRRRAHPPFANPVLLGAVTVLVAIIAVFLAYNANNGLPFVPVRKVEVDFANGDAVVPNNEVREGGFRVGVVNDMRPIRLADGTTGAQVELLLSPSTLVTPTSRFDIRPLSVLGLKYVELIRGSGNRSVRSGYVFRESQTAASLDVDRLFNTFDAPTRRGVKQVLNGLGDTWAARGGDVNQALSVFPDVFTHLTPVMATLADPRNDFGGLLQALDGTLRVVSPTSQTFSHLFTTMADTWGAISHDEAALERTTAESPSTLSVSTASMAVQKPFYDDTTGFSEDLTRATDQLGPTLPVLSSALEAGPQVLRRSVSLDRRTGDFLRALHDFAADPSTPMALQNLLSTLGTLRPLIRYLGPYQTVCDYWNYLFTDLADTLSEDDPFGLAERALPMSAGSQSNGISSSDAVVPANGEGYISATSFRGDPQYLHAQAFGAAVNDNGTANCESGQRGYVYHWATGEPARFRTVGNTHDPVDVGPTYMGRAQVPAGETFDRMPQGDPVLP